MTDTGLTVDEPMKMDDDENDSVRFLLAGGTFGPSDMQMTQQQKLNALIPVGYRKHELAQRKDIHPNQAKMTGDLAEYFAKKTMNLRKPVATDPWGQGFK